MHPITTPIKADDKEAITNLQAALVFLLNKSVFKTYVTPNNPTEWLLKVLKATLQEEQQSAFYGDATKQLIFIFQGQRGLTDNFKGEIAETTSAKLNEVLKGLGAFDEAENEIAKKENKISALTNGLYKIQDKSKGKIQ